MRYAFNSLPPRGGAFGLASALRCHGRNMFRISTVETRSQRTLVVEGTLMGPWVPELRTTWRNAAAALNGRKLVIDLCNVTVISQEGEEAIFSLMKEGVEFSCGGVLNRHVLKRLARKCHGNVQDAMNLTNRAPETAQSPRR